MAAFVYHLRVTKGYDNIYGLSIWNEPNALSGYGTSLPSGFLALYEPVRAKLDALVLSYIKIIGPDTTTPDPRFINNLMPSYGVYWDQISNHDYGSWCGNAVGNWSSLVNNINANYGGKPVIVGEYGNFGNKSGPVDNDANVYNGSISCAHMVIRYMNAGVKGFLEWEFAIYGDTWRCFGALTASDPNYVFKAYGPKYWTRSVLGRYVRAGWKVMNVNEDVTGTGNVVCAVLRAPDNNQTTILISNFSTSGYNLGIDLSSLPNKLTTLNNVYVTGPVPNGITEGNPVVLNNGIGSLYVNPKSVVALTTLPVGDLNAPNQMAVEW
ncbi:MAG TPA: hypothetical protein GXX14_13210 [Clostridiaceae bacterium]|nr:hypothetical protein [Clostridiaceae bacterium]